MQDPAVVFVRLLPSRINNTVWAVKTNICFALSIHSSLLQGARIFVNIVVTIRYYESTEYVVALNICTEDYTNIIQQITALASVYEVQN